MDFKHKTRFGQTFFHYACINGHIKIAEILIQKSAKFNIDLNVKDIDENTGFHLACDWGKKNIIDIIMNNSECFKIDVTAKKQAQLYWILGGFQEENI